MGVKEFKTLEEYYDFFKDIPDEEWCTGDFHNSIGQHCAIGHLQNAAEDHSFNTAAPLRSLMQINHSIVGINHSVVTINDGGTRTTKQLGSTPKERILNAILLTSAELEH